MKITFTGHRPNKLGNEYGHKGPYTTYIIDQLRSILNQLQPERGNNGMAIGFDFISAMVCIEMGILLHCYIPCKDQEKIWSKPTQELYHKILSKATEIHWVSKEPYSKSCMQNRNIAMIDPLIPEIDKVISCHNGSFGGTWNCIRYAEGKGFRTSKGSIINIDPTYALMSLK